MKTAKKEIRRLFTPLRRKVGDATAAATLEANSGTAGIHKFVLIKVYASDVFVLLDSGAVPNLLSQELVELLNLSVKDTLKTITCANGSNTSIADRARNVPITLGASMTSQIDFLAVINASFGLIIGLSQMNKMEAVIELGNMFVDLMQ